MRMPAFVSEERIDTDDKVGGAKIYRRYEALSLI